MSSSNHDAKSKDHLVSASLSSASALMALQLFSRLFTFALNQALVRLASPAAFGTAAIQFELILSTILFLSREGIRNALLRVPANDTPDDKARRMNLALLPVFIGIPLSLVTSLLYAWFASQEVRSQPHFHAAVALYIAAAILELVSEPLYNRAMTELKTNVRVRAEGLAITFKSIVTVAILVYDPKDLALVAFAVGQFTYSAVLLQSYLTSLGSDGIKFKQPIAKQVLPSSTLKTYSDQLDRDSGHFDHTVLRLAFTMSSQSVVKHFLTEGDKLILSWFSPLQDQGGYAIAVNYGSLIARIIFQPIEESLRLFFSRNLADIPVGKAPKQSTQQQRLKQSAATLQALLAVQLAFSVIVTAFGSLYLSTLLPIFLPPQYLATSAPSVLAAWVWYIPALAINGGLEAFLSSVASPQDLNAQSRWMVLFSVIYILSSIAFYNLQIGDASLVYANIINLLCRIAYCVHFATYFFQRHSNGKSFMSLRPILPPFSFLVVVAASVLLVGASESHIDSSRIGSRAGKRALLNPYFVAHVAVGGFLAVCCLSVWWFRSGRQLRSSLQQHKKQQ